MSGSPRVLLTGGAGYIGSLLAPALLDRGAEVTVLDSFRRGAAGLLPWLHDGRLHVLRGDVRDPAQAREIERHDVVVHLAAIVGFPACDAEPLEAESINVRGTECILAALRRDQLLVMPSTGSCYGRVDGLCTEEQPINPLTLYGRTKAEAEARARGHARTVVLRLATLFGVSPSHRHDLLVNDLVRRAVADRSIVLYEGGAMRSLLHVRDCVRAMLLPIDRADAMAGKIYNAGDAALSLTKRQIVAAITERAPAKVIEADYAKDPEMRNYEVSFDRIRALGFEAKVGLDAGILELCKLYRTGAEDARR